jgi:hypothetical protein
MDIANFFGQIPQMPAVIVRDVLHQKGIKEYNLVDPSSDALGPGGGMRG